MAAPRVNGGRTRQGSESPLFCTPPTEETIGNLDNACDCYEENTKTGWPAATAATFGHTPMYYPTHTQVTQPVQKDDYQLFGSIRGGPSPTRIPDLYSQSSASQQWHYSQHALRSTTAPAGGSITSFSDPFEASPIQERNHLSSDKTGKSHLMTSISPSTTPSSITTSRPLQIFPSLGDLTGYVSSEKEEEERSPVQVRGKNTTQPAKETRRSALPVAYKSAEIVISGSSSIVPDYGHSQRQHLGSKRSTLATPKRSKTSAPQQQLRIGKTTQTPTSRKPQNMASRGRIPGNTIRGGDHAMNNRPSPPAASSINTKRPKMNCGFIMDSEDESDIEEYDRQDEHQGDVYSELTTRPLPPTQPALDQRSVEPSTTPLPTKQVNKFRLKKLLGRNTSSKQSQQASPPKRIDTATPVSAPARRSAASFTNQPRAPVKLDGVKKDANRAHVSTIGRLLMKDMQGQKLEQQKNHGPQGSALRTAQKESQGLAEGQRPAFLERTSSHSASKTHASPRVVQGPADASGTPLRPHVQQKQLVPSANTKSGSTDAIANGSSSQASLPRSLLQSTLEDAIGASAVAASKPQASASKEKRKDKSNRPSTTTRPTTQRPGTGPQLRSKTQDVPSTTERQRSPISTIKIQGCPPMKQPTWGVQTPGVTATNTAQSQYQKSGLIPNPRAPSPKVQTTSGSSAMPTVVPRTKLSQKRKADGISGGPSNTAAPSKKPAVAPGGSSSRPASDVQAKSKVGTCPSAASNASPIMVAPDNDKSIEARKPQTITRSATESGSSSYAPKSTSSRSAFNMSPPTTVSQSCDKQLQQNASPTTESQTTTRIPLDESSSFPAPGLQAKSKAGTSTDTATSNAGSKAVAHGIPAETKKSLTFATPTTEPRSSSHSARPPETTNEVHRPLAASVSRGSVEQKELQVSVSRDRSATPYMPSSLAGIGNAAANAPNSAGGASTSPTAANRLFQNPSREATVSMVNSLKSGSENSSDAANKPSAVQATVASGQLEEPTVKGISSGKAHTAAALAELTREASVGGAAVPFSKTSVSPQGWIDDGKKASASTNPAVKLTTLAGIARPKPPTADKSQPSAQQMAFATSSNFAEATDVSSPSTSTVVSSASTKAADNAAPGIHQPQSFENRLKDASGPNGLHIEAEAEQKLVQENKANTCAAGAAKVFADAEQLSTPSTITGGVKASSIFSTRPLPVSQKAKVVSEVVLTPPMSPPVGRTITVEDPMEVDADVLSLSSSLGISKDAEPYFEYSIFQKTWTSEQSEADVASTEITVRSFTSIAEANAQAEKMVLAIREQQFQNILCEWNNKRDEHGCSVFVGIRSFFDYPVMKSHLKIWVQRNCVSKFANRSPQALPGACFISSTAYVLRLFRLVSASEASDDEDNDGPRTPPIRAYHPHSRPEIYTTLEAANRAARYLQIELSHEKDPKDAMTRLFQEKGLERLNEKVLGLDSKSGEDAFWKSKFNACGVGGDSLELVVEQAGICGPRNL